MKKLFLTTLLVFVAVFAFAQTVQKTYNFGTPTVSEVNGYDVIRFADTYNNGVVGEAALPYQAVSLLLPQNADAQNITVEYSDFVELEGAYNIMPQQKARPLSSTEPLVFEKNEKFYRSENVYPDVTYSSVKTQYLNGCSFAFAKFTPVRYIPATGKVSYAKTVTVTVELTASKTDRSSKVWMTPEVQSTVERLAQNPEAVKEYKTRARTITGYELLVITPQEWVPYFDEYVAFYEARGLRTHVTALEDILANFAGRDDAEKMRYYIIQEYENQGIEMVLLGGDSGVVPWRALYCNVWDEEVDNLPADMYFACLDGTWNDDNDNLWGEVGEEDLLPELAIARMPFNNEIQFNNMMHKTLEYQANPVLGEFHDVILGAEHLGDGYYGSTDLEMLIGGSSEFGYTTVGIPEDYNFIKIYEGSPSGWSGTIFKKAINQYGGQYVHHVGHANTDYVAGWYVNSTNDATFAQLDGVNHNYNFFHSHGCICGDFTHTCMLERLVNISTGFVASTGNSRYGWYQPWGDGMAAHLHREFVDAYYNDRLPYIGTAFKEMKVMTAPYVEWDPCMRWNVYDINILGDVAVCPWLDEPFRPEVSYEAALALGTTTMPVTITKRGEPQSNFRCSIFHNGDLLAFGLTDDNGHADISFAEALNVADTLQLIITGPNAWPQTINIVGINNNVAYVFPQNIDIHGGFLSGSNISMDVDFKNAGAVDANNVVATLSSASSFITMSKATVTVGTVNAGATVSIANAFDINVANDIPDDTDVDFIMSCTDGVNVWEREVHFIVSSPLLIINEIMYEEASGDMDGYIEPGETFTVTVKGKNKGHYMAANSYVHGNFDTQNLSFITNDISVGNLNVGDEFVGTIEILVADNAPEGEVVTINVSAITGQYSNGDDIVLIIGAVKEDFETGDFSKFNWKHWGDAEWFVTDSVAHTGSYSAQCGNIGKNQMTSIIINISNTTSGTFSFYYKTNTKIRKDYLIIYIDGAVKGYWSGDVDWTMFSYDLKAGNHKLEWRYDTAASGATDGNVCWVDDICFPENTMILSVENVVADNEVAVYPNPANDVINVKGEGIKYVEIYNSIGLKVLDRNVNDSESIDIAAFASGIYFVRVIDREGNISTTKIVKR